MRLNFPRWFNAIARLYGRPVRQAQILQTGRDPYKHPNDAWLEVWTRDQLEDWKRKRGEEWWARAGAPRVQVGPDAIGPVEPEFRIDGHVSGPPYDQERA